MRKLMNKKLNKKGFTLMEMLIVVAIIAILVAIAIPTFSNALQKAKIAADEANLRALYSEKVTEYLLSDGTAKIDAKMFKMDNAGAADATGNSFTVAGTNYKMQAKGATATATVNTAGDVLTIAYTYTKGTGTETVTIPGATTTTAGGTTGGGTGTP